MFKYISYEGLGYKRRGVAMFGVAKRIGVLAWIFTGSFSKNAGIISVKG
ncbi:hypothetical protein [Bartonella queenslandensis]|nr:hypothetical protein [Bartonella queenslandensis]